MTKPAKARITRELAAMMAGGRAQALSASDLRIRELDRKLALELPWRHSYANWCTQIGSAAARHHARIAFGAETHDAWQAGISPDEYAKVRGTR